MIIILGATALQTSFYNYRILIDKIGISASKIAKLPITIAVNVFYIDTYTRAYYLSNNGSAYSR